MHSYIEKVFAFVVAIGIVAAFSPSVSAANIGTADQFVASVAGDPTGTHTLTADIELSGWTPCDFAGTLDGAGHKITGLTGALFSNLTGTVKDLTIQGSATEIAITADADFGVLAVVASGATVSGCTVSGFKLVSQQVTKTIYPGMGFFVGRAYDGCTFTGCTTADDCSAVLGVNTFCGGIVGRVDRSDACTVIGLASFSDCVNRAEFTSSVAMSVAGNGAAGGIIGIFAKTGTGTTANEASVDVSHCENYGSLVLPAGDVAISHVFGGIVGKYEGQGATISKNMLTISRCYNGGDYRKESGSSKNAIFGGMIGVCGTYASKMRLELCVNEGDVIATGSSSTTACCFGGLIGYDNAPSKNHSLVIVNSVNRGSVSLTGSCNGASGAIGYIRFVNATTASGGGISIEIENCSFEGSVTADKKGLIAVAGAQSRAGTVFNVRNCWVSEDASRLLNYETYVSDYSESDLQIHVAGNDAAECTALNGVAAGVDEYLAWTVNAATTHPEPALPFTVRFVDWDGTLLKQELVSPGAAATAPSDPSRTGYTFGGWDPATFDNVTADMTIRAWYKCTVVFNSWDGQFASVSVREGGVVTKPATNPVWEYHTFQYWALGGAEYDFATPVTAALTLTAEFTAVTYPVSFFDWDGNQIGETQYVPHGEAAVAPTRPPDPEGMYFKKWSCDFSNVTSPLEVTMIMSSSSSSLWVSATGVDEDGRGTMAKPFKTIAYAVSRFDPEEGGTVYVMPGLYPQSKQTRLDAPIRVMGSSGNPADVILTNKQASATAQIDRFFRVNHERAMVANLTMVDGSGSADGSDAYNYHNGGAFTIREAGGTVSNCVVRHGRSLHFSSRGAGAYLYNGLVTHCVFTGLFSTCPAYNADPSAEGVVIHCNGADARIENTLVYDAVPTAVDDGPSQGPVVAIVKGLMRNCTVVPNTTLSSTASSDAKYKLWNTDGGCAVRCGSGGRVENCAVAGLKNINGELKPFGGTLANFYSCIGDGDMDLSAMHNCRHASETEMFLDPSGKDYHPRALGALVNWALDVPGYGSLVDLGGMKRVIKILDVGCYESQFVPGLVITGKRID